MLSSLPDNIPALSTPPSFHKISSPVYLLVSDVHFGKGTRKEERVKEDDLLALLDHCSGELDGLVLLGDVFDQYIEYRHLVPKGAVRFVAALSHLAASGVPVLYLVGNHDPWHLDYFSEELGVAVVRDTHEISVGGCQIVVSHGDTLGRGLLSRIAQRITRSSVSMALYRTLLPADFGYKFACFIKNKLESSETPEPEVVDRLRAAAKEILLDGRDVVVLAHSHQAELIEWQEGLYANTGSWHHDRCLAAVEAVSESAGGENALRRGDRQESPSGRIRLGRWNGQDIVWYSDAKFESQGRAETLPKRNKDVRRTFGLA